MLYAPGNVPELSRECLKRNVAIVVVDFPATPLTLARARICISASHTLEDLNYGLDVKSFNPLSTADLLCQVLDEMSNLINIRYSKSRAAKAAAPSNQICRTLVS